MAGLTPLPTYITHSTTRLTHRSAHTFLSTFLEQAEFNAAYRPDSTLSERGPQSTSTGANPNLTLKHLKRILQGIEGKRVGGGDDLGYFLGTDPRQQSSVSRKRRREAGEDTPKKKRARELIEDSNVEDSGPEIVVAEESEGWQDKEDYELAQDDVVEDIAADEAHPGMGLEQPQNSLEEQKLVEIEIEGTGEMVDPREGGSKSKMDKEERKKLKKLRMKEEQKNKIKEKSKKA